MTEESMACDCPRCTLKRIAKQEVERASELAEELRKSTERLVRIKDKIGKLSDQDDLEGSEQEQGPEPVLSPAEEKEVEEALHIWATFGQGILAKPPFNLKPGSGAAKLVFDLWVGGKISLHIEREDFFDAINAEDNIDEKGDMVCVRLSV